MIICDDEDLVVTQFLIWLEFGWFDDDELRRGVTVRLECMVAYVKLLVVVFD